MEGFFVVVVCVITGYIALVKSIIFMEVLDLSLIVLWIPSASQFISHMFCLSSEIKVQHLSLHFCVYYYYVFYLV